MTSSELIEKLKEYDPETPVLVTKRYQGALKDLVDIDDHIRYVGGSIVLDSTETI